MGLEKEKRPFLAQGGLQVNGASTFSAAVSFTAAVTHSGAMTHTGNIVQSTGSGLVQHIQSLTGASTATALVNYGVTKITCVSSTESATAANLVFTLNAPIAGMTKTIVVQADSTKTMQVRTPTSAATFYGTTFNALSWSTNGTSTGAPPAVLLLGLSTVQWAVLTAQTGITLIGATA